MTSTSAPAAERRGDGDVRRRRRRRPWLRRHPFLAVLIALVAIVLVAGVLPLAIAAPSLLGARAETTAARETLADADLEAAVSHLEAAERRFTSARRVLRNPVAAVGGVLPILGQNLRTAGALASAGERTARAAGAGVGAVEALPGGIAALAPSDGVLPIEPLEALAPVLAEAAADLAAAQAEVEGSPELALAGPVRDAREEFREILGEAVPAVDSAAALTDALPAFLGADGPRRYFFGATNPAELRGSGGFVGSFTILVIDEGRLRFGEFDDTTDLPVLPWNVLDPPNPDYAARYNRFGGAGVWHNINMTPDFPAAATAIEQLYERVRGVELDGTILADPYALEALLQVGGAAEVPGVGEVGADEVVGFVANEAYALFDSHDERKQVLGAVAAASLESLLGSGDADPQDLAEALGAVLGDGHLLLHAKDPAVQEAFETAGVAGHLRDEPGDYLAVVGNNAGNHKVDFYVEREVSYRAELRHRGRVDGEVEIVLRNEAPTEGSSHVLGPNVDGVEAGDNRTVTSIFCAPGCELEELRREGRPIVPVVEEEGGRPVYSFNLRVPAGEEGRASMAHRTAEGWIPGPHGETGLYRLVWQEQNTIRPTHLDLEITVPAGMHVQRVSDGLEQVGDRLRFAGPVRGDHVFEIEFSLPERQRMRAAVERLLRRDLIRIGGDETG